MPVTVELTSHVSVGDASTAATGYVADSASGNGKRADIMLATERDGSRTLYWRPPFGGGAWIQQSGEWTLEQLAGMLPAQATTDTRVGALNAIETALTDFEADYDTEFILDGLAAAGYSNEAIVEGAVPDDEFWPIVKRSQVCTEPTSEVQSLRDASEVEPAVAIHLLLTDSGGFAGLYGNTDAERTRLGSTMMYADLAGEPLFEFASLVLPSGAVVPAKFTSQQTPFDEDDYAQHTLRFTPNPEGSIVGAMVAKDPSIEYVVSWSLDGRS